MAQQVEQNNFIVSYPSPPSYFTDDIEPPKNIPTSGYATLSEQYNGVVSVQLEGRKLFYNSKDYKKELKRHFTKVLIDSVNFSKCVENKLDSSTTSLLSHALNNATNDIYHCINEYRTHIAREILLQDLNSKLGAIKVLELELKRLNNSLYKFSQL